MTVYQAQIDKAEELIKAKGQPIIIKRPGNDVQQTYTEQDFGSVSASGSIFSFSSDVSSYISIGDTIEFREIDSFTNRGAFEVTDVSTTDVTVDGSLETATEDTYYLDLSTTDDKTTIGYGVPLPPKSVTRQNFDQAFQNGTLQISKAKDVIIAAKNLSMNPRPGDRMQFGTTTWNNSLPIWDIFGIGTIDPDGTPIVWQGIIQRG